VDDIVNANIFAMLVDNHEHYGEVFNVGTGTNHSVRELAAMISDNTVDVEPRVGESRITLANNQKIRKILGWAPTRKIEDYVKESL
jgi:nucleoside-diphosphate-sugar epimerase